MTESIQWGVLYQVPNVDPEQAETAQDLDEAMRIVRNVDKACGDGSAHLAYRTVIYGEWQSSIDGDQWGTRYTWAGGHVEVQVREDRRDAEMWAAMNSRSESVADVVSRTVEYGQWLAASAVAA